VGYSTYIRRLRKNIKSCCSLRRRILDCPRRGRRLY